MVKSSLEAHPVRSFAEGFERFVSFAAYFLPIADGFHYGRYLFSSYPVFKDIFAPILPLIYDFEGYQYAALLTSFLLLVGVVLNSRLSRFTRVHAGQALVLESMVWVPRLIDSVLHLSHGPIYQNLSSALWLFIATSGLVSAIAALIGNRVWLPLVSETAEAQIR